MKNYKIMFNNGCWEDIISFNTEASSEQDALEIILGQNPEYCSWNNFISC